MTQPVLSTRTASGPCWSRLTLQFEDQEVRYFFAGFYHRRRCSEVSETVAHAFFRARQEVDEMIVQSSTPGLVESLKRVIVLKRVCVALLRVESKVRHWGGLTTLAVARLMGVHV